MDCLVCCSSCKPRYKRLVDSIYPRTLREELISGNMQKLTFYSISHPEKLNRIGIYLVNRLSRDLYRQKFAGVKVAVDAMDQLLKSCHGSPSLNQFIENYLKMVQKLLETNDPQMEKLATDLFVRFSTIEEDSPSYHRQYDFFISKFSSMCYSNRGDCIKSRRYNGLRGLRGIIWKSANNDLQANIWEKQHMDKIIPSILFNLYEEEEVEDNVDHGTNMLFHHYPDDNLNVDDPKSLSLQCLRELFGKCSFGSLKCVLRPVFEHFDLNQKWLPPATFAVTTFKAILCSIQTQNSSFVIQELINHLEQMPNNEVYVRIGIATVLYSIVSIAGTTIGPLLLAIFNSLLKRLRLSVEFQQSKQCQDRAAEKAFQETLINALGDFANAQPDYQKVEIMMFTVGNVPTINDSERSMKTSDAFLQKVLVKTILKIATKYKTLYLATVFTDSFLKTLFHLALINDSEVRLIALQIFHTLLDRHDNLSKLEHLPFVLDVLELQLTIEKCSRQDQLFMRRHIQSIVHVLYRSVASVEDNEHLNDHMDALLCSMALLCVEVGHDETLVELFRLAFVLQTLAVENFQEYGAKKTAAIHNLVAKYLNLSSQLLAIPTLCNHIQQTIKTRAQRGHPLLNIMNPDSGDDNAALRKSSEALASTMTPDDEGAGEKRKTVKCAPIAHMESEDEQLTTARPFSLGVESDDADALLFDINTVYDALKASNKDVAGLLVPFKPSIVVPPLSGSRAGGSASLDATDASAKNGLGAVKKSSLTSVTADKDHLLDVGGSSSNLAGAGLDESSPSLLLHQSPDQSSIESSSIDWTPPDSRHPSRRNTIFVLKSSELALPATVESIRAAVNAPLDPSEEERQEREKSMNILNVFRDKNADQLLQLFQKQQHHANVGDGDSSIATNVRADAAEGPSLLGNHDEAAEVAAEDLTRTLERMNKRHSEWVKMVECGHDSMMESVFDLKFPQFFVN